MSLSPGRDCRYVSRCPLPAARCPLRLPFCVERRVDCMGFGCFVAMFVPMTSSATTAADARQACTAAKRMHHFHTVGSVPRCGRARPQCGARVCTTLAMARTAQAQTLLRWTTERTTSALFSLILVLAQQVLWHTATGRRWLDEVQRGIRCAM